MTSCNRCGGRGWKTGLGGRPLRRITWPCTRCYQTGVIVLVARLVVGTGARQLPAPVGWRRVVA